MPEYRDYGAIRGATAPQVAINEDTRTQVYMATHNGDLYLPYKDRAFISFSYGGKNIEDFNLIAITENNSLNRKGYANFIDNVTTSDIYDGQLYWSTHFQNNEFSFTLATDGMTEEQLNSFKQWFKPGEIKELILSENPNRAILARVSTVPLLNLLGFEKQVNVTIAEEIYKVTTALYKGTINLTLVMDEPFWYSKVNILDHKNSDGTFKAVYWEDANKQLTYIFQNKDALKIILEDRIPVSVMLPKDETVNILFGTESGLGFDLSYEPTGPRVGYAKIGQAIIPYVLIGKDAGLNLGASDLTPGEEVIVSPGYFYYAGTAPCKPILMFTLTPVLDNQGYITSPCNDYSDNTGNIYNKIVIESTDKTEFRFTTPSIYTGYNQALKVFLTASSGVAWEDIRIILRETVKHYAPRNYAISLIDALRGGTTSTTTEKLNQIISQMPTFLKDSNNQLAPAIFTFNSNDGQSTAMVTYHKTTSQIVSQFEENVSDMVRSNYLIIKDRNTFSTDGLILPWSAQHPDYSYRIYTDVSNGLENVSLNYKYFYL